MSFAIYHYYDVPFFFCFCVCFWVCLLVYNYVPIRTLLGSGSASPVLPGCTALRWVRHPNQTAFHVLRALQIQITVAPTAMPAKRAPLARSVIIYQGRYRALIAVLEAIRTARLSLIAPSASLASTSPWEGKHRALRAPLAHLAM